MRKNIIIALLSVVSIASLMYGFVQRQQAIRLEALFVEIEERAKVAEEIARRSMEEAQTQKAIATEQARMAQENARIAMQALEEARRRR